MPLLGADTVAASVKPADVETMRDALIARKLAAASVVQTIAILSKLYNYGLKEGLIECPNPAARIDRPRPAVVDDLLEAVEVARLLRTAEAQAKADGATYTAKVRWPMVAAAVYAGPRKGELFGLRWSDVHFEAERIDVARSYRLLPKSGKARVVGLHPDLAPVLRWWKEQCPAVEGLCFPVEYSPGKFRMGFKNDDLEIAELFKAAECHDPADGKRWHLLRHTFGSHAVMAGTPLYAVQEMMGHANHKTTQRYAKHAPGYLVAQVARMSFAVPAPAGVADLGAERRKRAAGKGRPAQGRQPGQLGPHLGQTGNKGQLGPAPGKKKAR